MRKALGRALPVSLAVIAASAGVAYATGALSSAPSTIVGCAKNVNGQLRIVGSPSDCAPSEHAVQFAAPQAPNGPAAVTVDCAAGQSVNQALADTADATQVDITIKGTCTEPVHIFRDDVTLQGAAPGDGLTQPSGHTVLTVDSARRVELDQLTITGGQSGLSILDGAQVLAFDLHVSSADDQDVSADSGTSLILNNAIVEGGDIGLIAHSGGSIDMNNATVSGSHHFAVEADKNGTIGIGGGTLVTGAGSQGVIATQGGTVDLGDATVQNNGGAGVFVFTGGNAFVAQGTVVQHNGQGGVPANSGTVEIQGHVTSNNGCGVCGFNGARITLQNGAVVDSNQGNGINMSVGSTLAVGNNVSILNNAQNGVQLHDTTVGGFDSSDHISGNHLWGVLCDGPPAVALVTHGPGWAATVSGNGAGNISCPSA